MKLIVITAPWVVEHEAQLINQLFDAGMSCLHLRKPACAIDQFRELLRDIKPAFYQYIVLHQHHMLVDEMELKGVHYPEDQRLKTPAEIFSAYRDRGLTVSTSIHNVTSLADVKAFDYVFIGPVFNSISKPGYHALPNKIIRELGSAQGPALIALGGINQDNLNQVLKMDFDGVAVLGHLWMEPMDALERFTELQTKLQMNLDRQISRLHYISQESADNTHLSAITTALNAGCRWIQLRVKNREEKDVLKIALEVRDLCNKYGATLIINDYPEVARQVNAHGLHLGLLDMPVAEARLIVGAEPLIGGTANTFAHIRQRVAEGVDYIGLGPYRFTKTKEKLSPILGISGFRTIMEQVRTAGIDIPIIAIGGITAADIPELLDAGVYGVAMSGAITLCTEPQVVVKDLYRTIRSNSTQ